MTNEHGEDDIEIVYVDSPEEADEIEIVEAATVPATAPVSSAPASGFKRWQIVVSAAAVIVAGAVVFTMIQVGAPEKPPTISERVGAKVDEKKEQASEKKAELTERAHTKIDALRADPDACADRGKMLQKAYWGPDGKRPTMRLRLTGDAVALPPAIGDRIIAEPSREVVGASVWVYQQDDRRVDVYWVDSLSATATDRERQAGETKAKRRKPGAAATATPQVPELPQVSPAVDSWWMAAVSTTGTLQVTAAEASGPDSAAHMPTVRYSEASCATVAGGAYRIVGDGFPASAEGPGPEQIRVAALKADGADPTLVWLVIEGELRKAVFEYAEDTDDGDTATVDEKKEQTDGK